MLLNVLKRQMFCRNEEILISCFRSSSSIVNDRVAGFNDVSATWWDPKGSMRHLHLIQPYRKSFVLHQLSLKDRAKPATTAHQPLAGYKIVDVGCGVGMMAEDLALSGANVVGLDPAERTIETAVAHAAANPLLEGKLKYLVATAENHVLTHNGQYDAVMAFFVLEHIQNRQEFIDNCLALLKPSGSLFIGNANRSFLLYCYLQWHRYVSGLIVRSIGLPHRKFVTDEEVIAMVNKKYVCELRGQQYLFWPLDGQSCRVTNSNRFMVLTHFVRRDAQ